MEKEIISDNLEKFYKRKKNIISISVGIVLFVIVYYFPFGSLQTLNGDMRAALGILILAAVLWMTEAIPLYVTSLVIVLGQIFFIQEKTVSSAEALAPFFSPIIALFLGGFVLAAALSQYELDLKMIKSVLKLAGRAPRSILFAMMGITGFLSMWMSNTATTALMIAIAVPIYTQIPKDDKFKKALILGVPFAANIGGMVTPIGTPPNAIIIEELSIKGTSIGFLDWMIMTLPLALILFIFTYFVLYFSFSSKTDSINIEMEEKIDSGFSKTQIFVLLIFMLTVALWLGSSIEVMGEFFQHPGFIALIPPVAFFSTGLLDKDDLADLNWDVLLLMGGGLSLGNAISSTGLDDWIVGLIGYGSMGIVLLILSFSAIAVVLSTFMSNTATASLMAPLMLAIGMDLGVEVSIMASIALACSVAMALPVSTPPNAIAYGTDVIEVKDMIKYGGLVSIMGIILLTIVFGFGLYIY